MEFIWSGSLDSKHIEKELFKNLKVAFLEDEGICYHKYPIFTSDRSRTGLDFLMFHRENGLYILKCLACELENIVKIWESQWEMHDWQTNSETPFLDAEDQMWAVLGKFRKERVLRNKKNDIIQGHVFIVLPFISKSSFQNKFNITSELINKIIFEEEITPIKLKEHLNNIPLDEIQDSISTEQYMTALAILQGTPVLRKPLRPKTSKKNSKAAMLREVEQQMLSMDREQQTLAVQIPPGPQRIRGLSGSGKTIVLCMKTAWMHLRNPEWIIVYTFYTRSLYKMIKSLITRFCQYWEDVDPNWDKIKIMHGWGGKSEAGVYSTISKEMEITPRTYAEATNIFTFTEYNELLGKCCNELLENDTSIPEIFDSIIIDEGQDFHFSFYKLCLDSLKEPKRLIWAYDEVQSLESLSIPTTIDIFGTDSDGNPVVDLEGAYDDEIEKDVILYRCYRTPRPVLVAAHIFGMGLLRPQGAVQFIPSQGGWEDIGYKVVSGTFKTGNIVTIRRPKENSPHKLEDLVGHSDLVKWQDFESRDEEIDWIANQIKSNIEVDELSPEEILVITFDRTKIGRYFSTLQNKLKGMGIDSIRPGYDSPRGEFQQKGNVTLSGIFPAKGNEASIVYLIGFDYIGSNDNIVVQLRNQAFTAITRTRGWVVLSGVGERAKKLFDEIKLIMNNPEEFTFRVPDPKTIQRNLDNLDYERKRNARKRLDELTREMRNLLATIDDPEIKERVLKRLSDIR